MLEITIIVLHHLSPNIYGGSGNDTVSFDYAMNNINLKVNGSYIKGQEQLEMLLSHVNDHAIKVRGYYNF